MVESCDVVPHQLAKLRPCRFDDPGGGADSPRLVQEAVARVVVGVLAERLGGDDPGRDGAGEPPQPEAGEHREKGRVPVPRRQVVAREHRVAVVHDEAVGPEHHQEVEALQDRVALIAAIVVGPVESFLDQASETFPNADMENPRDCRGELCAKDHVKCSKDPRIRVTAYAHQHDPEDDEVRRDEEEPTQAKLEAFEAKEA
mmetsp:Transcript_2445/g.5316  ORF Transcript_2445/g.5316 Transcript_2445/m.5316 type:complete len:201 (-) Transcript_2445:145-747(-)